MKKLTLTLIGLITLASCQKDYYKDDLLAAEAQVVELTVENTEYKNQIEALNTEINRLLGIILKHENTIANLNTDIDGYKTTISLLEVENADLLEKIAELEARIAELEALLAAERANVVILNELIVELNDANDDLLVINADSTEEIRILKEYIETLLTQIDTLIEQLNNQETKIITLEEIIERLSTEVINFMPKTLEDPNTFDFGAEDSFVFAGTLFTKNVERTYENNFTYFITFESQAGGSMTLKFRKPTSDFTGANLLEADWTQVRKDQADNYKFFANNAAGFDEVFNAETFATEYVAELEIDDTLTNSTAEELAAILAGDAPNSIVVNNVELVLDPDGLYSAAGVRIRFVAPNVQNIIIAVIDGSGTNLVRYNGVRDADAATAYLNAANNFLATVTSFE